MQESDSFWTDIKKLEEQLARTPDSFCFARLSEVYLKVGLVDDALYVARQGAQKHPGYLSGQRALSLACHAKGLDEEALAALQVVTAALPEDVSAQKLLGRLLAQAGNQDAAREAFRTALEFAPDDVECRIELESLGWTEDDEEVIEDLEILDEIEILEEEGEESESPLEAAAPEAEAASAPHHDPLSTGTLAELYVSQGFIHKALEIYRVILADNPADRAVADRVAELELLETAPSEAVSERDELYVDEDEAAEAPGMPSDLFAQESVMVADEPVGMPVPESSGLSEAGSWGESAAAEVPLQGAADNALATLDGWLENIRRIKSCR